MGSEGFWSPQTFLYNTWYTLLTSMLLPGCSVDRHTPSHTWWGCSGTLVALLVMGVCDSMVIFHFSSVPMSSFLVCVEGGCRAGVLGWCQQQLIYCPRELNTRKKIPQLSWPHVLRSNLASVVCRCSFRLPAV